MDKTSLFAFWIKCDQPFIFGDSSVRIIFLLENSRRHIPRVWCVIEKEQPTMHVGYFQQNLFFKGRNGFIQGTFRKPYLCIEYLKIRVCHPASEYRVDFGH